MTKDTNLKEINTNDLYNKQKLLEQIENSPTYKRYDIEYEEFRNIVSLSTIILFLLINAVNFIFGDFNILNFIVRFVPLFLSSAILNFITWSIIFFKDMDIDLYKKIKEYDKEYVPIEYYNEAVKSFKLKNNQIELPKKNKQLINNEPIKLNFINTSQSELEKELSILNDLINELNDKNEDYSIYKNQLNILQNTINNYERMNDETKEMTKQNIDIMIEKIKLKIDDEKEYENLEIEAEARALNNYLKNDS